MELPQETLGLLLIRGGFVNRSQLYEGLRRQRRTGERIGEALIALGLISAQDVSETLAVQLSTPLIPCELAEELATAHRDLVSPEFVEETGAIPIGQIDGKLLFVVASRSAITALEDTERLPDSQFGIYLVADHEFGRVLAAYRGAEEETIEGSSPPEASTLTFHEALEKLYEATDEAGLARAAGQASANFFSRVAVLRPNGETLELVESLGFTALEGAELSKSEPWLSPGVYYGVLDGGPDAGRIAESLGCDGAQAGLIWLLGELPDQGFVVYGDHAGTDQVYDDLQDLEGLFNEVKTALELLNNGSG